MPEVVFSEKAKCPGEAELSEVLGRSKKYAESRPARVEVKLKKDVELVMQLAKIKMAT